MIAERSAASGRRQPPGGVCSFRKEFLGKWNAIGMFAHPARLQCCQKRSRSQPCVMLIGLISETCFADR